MNKKILLDLWSQAPLSWAIIRAQECRLLKEQKFIPPILEIGCGDGLISQIVFNNKNASIDLGIDLDSKELHRAEKTKLYKKLLLLDITKNNFKPNSFNTVFANGVLEHIPNLDKTLREVSKILKPNGLLITTSPSINYTGLLFYHRLFSLLGFKKLAEDYGNKINTVFVHKHLLSKKDWEDICKKNNLNVVRITSYNNPLVVALHDLFLPFSVFTKLIKNYTDKMVLFINLRRVILNPLIPLLDKIVTAQSQRNASLLIVARKK